MNLSQKNLNLKEKLLNTVKLSAREDLGVVGAAASVRPPLQEVVRFIMNSAVRDAEGLRLALSGLRRTVGAVREKAGAQCRRCRWSLAAWRRFAFSCFFSQTVHLPDGRGGGGGGGGRDARTTPRAAASATKAASRLWQLYPKRALRLVVTTVSICMDARRSARRDSRMTRSSSLSLEVRLWAIAVKTLESKDRQ